MPDLAAICRRCQELRMAWLDSTPSVVIPRFGIAHGSGAEYDRTAAGVRDNRRARHDAWAALVREQMAGIARDCRAAGHSTGPG